MLNYSRVYEGLKEQIGLEEWNKRSRARAALYNNYGFCPDITRIAIYDAPDNVIRFGIGRHVYELEGSVLTKVE